MDPARHNAMRGAAVALAAAMAAGLSAPSAAGCVTAPAMPRRPAGVRCLQYFPVPAPPQAQRWGPLEATRALDPSSPAAGPSVLALRILSEPEQSRPGRTATQRPPGANEYSAGMQTGIAMTAAYFSFWMRFNPELGDPTEDLDLSIVLRENGRSGGLQLTLMNSASGTVRPGLRATGLNSGYNGSTSPLLDANLAPGALSPGWHRWEIVVSANSPGASDGAISWWIDGAPAGHHTGLDISASEAPVFDFVGWLAQVKRWRAGFPWYVYLAAVYLGGLSSDDQIVIENNTATSPDIDPERETVVLLDANGPWLDNLSPCLNDRVVPTPFEVRRLTTSSTCSPKDGTADPFADELLVFSVDDSMAYDVQPWSILGGEVRTVTLGPPFVVPVSVWLLREFDDDGVRTKDRALDEVKTAIMLFNTGRTGIVFSPTPTVHEIYGSTAIPNRCPVPTGSATFDAGRLNVYYLPTVTAPDGWGGFRGYNCPDASGTDPNQRFAILIALDYNDGTVLAHELGHALAQVHAGTTVLNPDPDYSDMTEANVMWEGSSNRKTLTLGQAFRMNLDYRSALVTLGLRTGPTRTCDYDLTNGDLNRRCPRMGLDQ